MARGGVDVKAAEVAAPFAVEFWTAVDELLLVAEDDEPTPGNLLLHQRR